MNMARRPLCVIALVLGLSLPVSSWAAGDPEGERNLASSSPLPRGNGIAQSLDAGNPASHPAIIFADDFEGGDFTNRWDSVRNDQGNVLSLVAPAEPDSRLGTKFLRVTASLGQNTGGGLTQWFEPHDTVFIRFLVRFDEACDYVHHFVTLRANRSLRGQERWSGFGGAGQRPIGNERFSTALEPWGNWGRATPPGHWNFYSYWHEMEPSPDGRYWGNAFRPARQTVIPRGVWICAEFMLKHNTPGNPDGEQAYWIDGALLGHWRNINWRTVPELKANALTLESYVTDRWTKNPINVVDFDDVIIAREYIGPPRR
jgi:hypothetical protein